MIKPTISATSYGTFRLRAEDSAGLAAALATIPESMALLVQEFVPEIQTVGEESYIFFDGRFSHAVRKRAKPGDFRVQEEFGGSREGFTATETQIAQAQEILRAGGAAEWLYARVDVIPVAGQMLLMELEAIDPMFYFAWADAEARPRFARAVAKRLGL